MRVGITAMLTDRSIRPDELARAAEELGFASLLLPEHTHLPLRSRGDHPTEQRVPDDYARTLDPFVALALAAGVTETLVLGTGIALLPVRDALLTAKEVATLDHLSGGRVVLGVGAGPQGLADVVSVADVWAPHGASGLAEALPRLTAACEAAGRDPATLRTVPVGTRPTAGKLDHLAALGVDEVVVLVPDTARGAALTELARIADVVDGWRGGAAAPAVERAGPAPAPRGSQAAPVGARRSRT